MTPALMYVEDASADARSKDPKCVTSVTSFTKGCPQLTLLFLAFVLESFCKGRYFLCHVLSWNHI